MRVIWSFRAIDDVEGILAFLRPRNRGAATRIAGRIRDAAALVAEYPESAPVSPDGVTREHAVATTPYVLIYRIGRDRVEILHVYHGARDR